MEREMLSSIGSCYAVTLTYENESASYDDQSGLILDNEHLKLFTKRIRNYCNRRKMPKDFTKKVVFKAGCNMRYYAVGEYGDDTGRPHFHIIYFNFPVIDQSQAYEMIKYAWDKGFVFIDQLSTKAMRYVCGYIVENKTKLKTAFVNRSKGIGSSYLTLNRQKYHKEHITPYGTKINGTSVRLHRYYMDKIFSMRDKEKIYKKGLEYFQTLSDEEVLQHVTSNRNLAESKKRQLSTNKKFKKL